MGKQQITKSPLTTYCWYLFGRSHDDMECSGISLGASVVRVLPETRSNDGMVFPKREPRGVHRNPMQIKLVLFQSMATHEPDAEHVPML
jgi:hypothetical protein